jgi:hypothetical protein
VFRPAPLLVVLLAGLCLPTAFGTLVYLAYLLFFVEDAHWRAYTIIGLALAPTAQFSVRCVSAPDQFLGAHVCLCVVMVGWAFCWGTPLPRSARTVYAATGSAKSSAHCTVQCPVFVSTPNPLHSRILVHACVYVVGLVLCAGVSCALRANHLAKCWGVLRRCRLRQFIRDALGVPYYVNGVLHSAAYTHGG